MVNRSKVSTSRALLRDEGGAAVMGWMYPFLLALLVVGVASDQSSAGHWQSAGFRLSLDLPVSLPHWLR